VSRRATGTEWQDLDLADCELHQMVTAGHRGRYPDSHSVAIMGRPVVMAGLFSSMATVD
jgi:hypothetical protein